MEDNNHPENIKRYSLPHKISVDHFNRHFQNHSERNGQADLAKYTEKGSGRCFKGKKIRKRPKIHKTQQP